MSHGCVDQKQACERQVSLIKLLCSISSLLAWSVKEMLAFSSVSNAKTAKYPIISVLWLCKLRQTNGNPLAFVVIVV